jgi:hypothetical protein
MSDETDSEGDVFAVDSGIFRITAEAPDTPDASATLKPPSDEASGSPADRSGIPVTSEDGKGRPKKKKSAKGTKGDKSSSKPPRAQAAPGKSIRLRFKGKTGRLASFEWEEHGERAARQGPLATLGRWLLKMGKIDGLDV